MKLIAIMPVRNEDWILGFSLRVALKWCDMVVCLNHASTDSTVEILEEVASETDGRVVFLHDNSPGWPEMVHRQRLLDVARQYGGTHIALIDADEVLCGDSLPTVRQHIEALAPSKFLAVAMYCMWRGLDRFRTDAGSVWSNRHDLAIAFADAPRLEFAATNGYQHHSRTPRGALQYRAFNPLGVMHLQFADWRRLVAKHARYKAMERLAYPQKSVAEIESLYNLAVDERGLQTTQSPPGWWAPYKDLFGYLKLGAEPWHEAEVRRLVKEHSRLTFEGLDLFGVAG